MDELQPANVGEFSGEEPEGNGQESTGNEAPLDGRVPGIILVTKDTSGSDGTPNDRGRVESPRGTAGEGSARGGADVRAGGDQPGGSDQVDGAGNEGRDELGHEHDSWGDLHVVTELQIGSEGQGLDVDNVTVGLEGNVGNGVTRENVTNDVLGDDVQTRLLVGDGLDDTDRQDEEYGNGHGKEDSPPWHVVVDDTSDNGKSQRDEEKGDVPPIGNFGINTHQAGVDILVLETGRLPALNQFLAVVQDDVDNGGSQTGEANSISEGEEGIHAHGTILEILNRVQMTVITQDLVLVPVGSVFTEEISGQDGIVLGLPEVLVVGPGDHDPGDEDETDQDVDLGEPRGDERSNIVRGSRPVEGNDTDAKTIGAGELGEDNVVWVDPADPGKCSDGGEDVAGEPVVDKGAEGDEQEVLQSRGAALILLRLSGGAGVERAEERSSDQG